MGRPKLLLPWGDGLLIDQVLNAWVSSRVDQVFVIVRKDDVELAEACRRSGAQIIFPTCDPLDMKESVQCGLRVIAESYQPLDQDRCFVAPADLPTLSPQIIDRLIAMESDASKIVVPRFGQRQGHPVLLPWPITKKIFELGPDEGVDHVVKRHEKRSVAFAEDERVMDVDTPEQYQRLREAAGG
jgi:molybdenum cofactor cytidylyltransferase